MSVNSVALLQCFALGFMSIITSCSLGTNIASVSMITTWCPTTLTKVRNCISFVLASFLVLLLLGLFLSFGFFKINDLKIINARWVSIFFGPMLVLMGMLVLRMFEFNFFKNSVIEKWHKKIVDKPYYAFGLGCFVNLNFCPLIAFSILVGMVPLAIESKQLILCPLSYALGYCFAIVLFSGVMIFLENWFFNKKAFQRWVTLFMGTGLILIGLWEIFSVNKTLFFS